MHVKEAVDQLHGIDEGVERTYPHDVVNAFRVVLYEDRAAPITVRITLQWSWPTDGDICSSAVLCRVWRSEGAFSDQIRNLVFHVSFLSANIIL